MVVGTGAKLVLMARPHPFIASAMRDLLSTLGWQPATPDAERPGLRPVGIVISLALQSSIAAAPVEVFRRVQQAYPRTPVVFASLADTATIFAGLERLLAGEPSAPPLRRIGAAGAGQPGTALYLTKADLDERSDEVSRVLRSFFGR